MLNKILVIAQHVATLQMCLEGNFKVRRIKNEESQVHYVPQKPSTSVQSFVIVKREQW